MALSFGRGKQGETKEAAPAPAPSGAAASGTKPPASEGLDESWFETALEEEKAAPQTSPFAAPAVPSSYVDSSNDSASEFDIFADLEEPVTRPARPAAASFNMADVTPTPAAPVSEAFGAADATPFDTAPVAVVPPAKAKGGLKKVLPLIGVVAILGGGAYFWISQQSSGPEELDAMPPTTAPAPPRPHAPPPPAPTQPTAAKPAPAPTGASPVKPADSGIKAQLKKLWDEGAAAKKAGKNADARKKWQEAVKLAKSKPGNEQSATLIQGAIDKLK